MDTEGIGLSVVEDVAGHVGLIEGGDGGDVGGLDAEFGGETGCAGRAASALVQVLFFEELLVEDTD